MTFKHTTLSIYAAGHFFVDLACAFLVLRYGRVGVSWLTALLLYNFFAFAMQMPLGLLADHLGSGRIFAAAGCLIIALSAFVRSSPLALCIIAGLGNAFFHIGGGHDVLGSSEQKASSLGIFVSPGAFGLFLGGLLQRTSFPTWSVLLILFVFAAGIFLLCPRTSGHPVFLGRLSLRSWMFVLLLLLVVCLRSYAGFLFRFPWKKGVWAWLFIAGVVLGKTLGGLLYDRFGGIKTSVASLLLSAILFLLSKYPVAGCAAVLLFNMTMPVTLRAAADLFPRAKAFSFGLLTFALFLGMLPAVLSKPLSTEPASYTVICLISLAALLPALKRGRP